MSGIVATTSEHAELAAALRGLVELVATHELDAVAVREATALLGRARDGLGASASRVETTRPGAISRWPVERSAVSGPLNPYAPPLVVNDASDHVEGVMVYPRALQGPPEHAHGGHLAMVFDHVAGRAAGGGGRAVVTGKLAVRYLRPTPVGRSIRFSARIREIRHSLITVDCASYDGEEKTAVAEATFVELGASHFQHAFQARPPES